MPSSSSGFVTFPRGDVTVPIAPWLLALRLEGRGCSFDVQDDRLVVRPRSLLTDAEVAELTRWRDDLIAIVTMCDSMDVQQ